MPQQSLSDQILQENADLWEEMQYHRFVADIETDQLDPVAVRHYLIYENAFVETAISIFGHMLVKSPGLEEQRKIISILSALSGEQIDYFQKTFTALGMTYEHLARVDLPISVLSFQQGMLSYAAHGDYLDSVTVMFAAEWMYWHWCKRVIAQPISDPIVRQWVALHTETAFASQAQWLKQQVDKQGSFLDVEGRRRVSRIFRNALQFEIAFHTAPYDEQGLSVSAGV